MYTSHIRKKENQVKAVQTSAEHCRETAVYAREALAAAGLGESAYLAGLIHDMGKFTDLFERYIRAAAEGKDVRRGSVNHTFAAVRYLLKTYHQPQCSSVSDIACELAAYAAGAHHSLFDGIDPDGVSGFVRRLEKQDIKADEAAKHFFEECASPEELDACFQRCVQETEAALLKIRSLTNKADECTFYFGMLCRLLLSAVIDGDRRSTADFMSGGALFKPSAADWGSLLQKVEQELASFPSDTPIAKARKSISAQCRRFAEEKSGIFRLCVPTGGGKTLSTLRYALAHAACFHKKRIFFVIPLLSVIEQNAVVLRKYIGDDSLILEHHSNLVSVQEADRLDDRELLTENWRAPIVVTTLVQFLNTLFIGKTSAVRRMSALAESVIVIDEVQSVPRHMLSQFNLALNFLSEVCGASIVLCSATQPSFDAVGHALRFSKMRDMVPFDQALWAPFSRTRIEDRRTPEGYSLEELSAFAAQVAEKSESLLVICNTKAQAAFLYQDLSNKTKARLFHLSTSMCPQHRMEVLEQINAALFHREQVVCVSTQLVEAGIDFSFSAVIRVDAGMDNIAQAAGRCNRNGEYTVLCPVYVVKLRKENLSRLREIRDAQNASLALKQRFLSHPEQFGGGLLSPEAVDFYYRCFFRMEAGGQDYPLPEYHTTMFRLLSDNQTFAAHCKNGAAYYLRQAFETAGHAFCVFEDNTVDVVVPYGEGEKIIADLCSERVKWDLVYEKTLLDRAKRYSISLFSYQKELLMKSGDVYEAGESGVLVLDDSCYQKDIGLCIDQTSDTFRKV